MTGRWNMLAVLFAVRATMGFQYQSIASVSPIVMQDLGIGLADLGLLIGLYLAPGAVIALPGGALGRWFGDKATVLAGLVFMFAGGLLMALVPIWSAQIAGRLLAGLGGVLLNVMMSKMVTDLFAGREIASAMAIFVNSWPVGIACALVALPPVGSALGVPAVHFVSAGVVAAGLLVLSALYRAPISSGNMAQSGAVPTGRALAAIMVAGVIWSLYNVAFAMIFGFGPAMLTERGWTVAAAGSTVSLVMWFTMLSVPAGGVLADWTRRHVAFIVVGALMFAAALITARRVDAIVAAFVVLGIVCGLPAGAIMSLPARALQPATRAVGMGLFFTLYYVGMFVAPAIAGWLAVKAGAAGVAFDFGAAVLVVTALLALAFPLLAAPATSAAAAPGVPSGPAKL